MDFCKQDSLTLYRMTMDNLSNASLNDTSPHPLNSPGFVVFNVVMLLGVVLPVIAVNTVILVALVFESAIVKAVHLVLGSILVSCILSALGLTMYHIAGIVLKLSPVNSPPTAPCTLTIFLIGFGGAARLVFMATFAVIVYIIVRYGQATKKHFVITSFVVVAVLWILALLGNSPLFSHAIIYTWYTASLSCSIIPIATYSYIYTVLYVFFFGLITLSVTITFLVITVRYIKCLTIQHIKLEIATVKFGFFLLLGNGINLLAQMVPPIIVTSIHPQPTSPDGPPLPSVVTYTPYTLLNAALIPTPILVLVYFKPIRERLWHWLCCCMPIAKKRKEEILSKYFHKDEVAVPGKQVVTTRL